MPETNAPPIESRAFVDVSPSWEFVSATQTSAAVAIVPTAPAIEINGTPPTSYCATGEAS